MSEVNLDTNLKFEEALKLLNQLAEHKVRVEGSGEVIESFAFEINKDSREILDNLGVNLELINDEYYKVNEYIDILVTIWNDIQAYYGRNIYWTGQRFVVERFEVGEEVRYHLCPDGDFKAKIFGIADKADDNTNEKYGIEYKDGRGNYRIRAVKEFSLHKLKPRDNLEKGDKCITRYGSKVKIIAREFDERYNTIKYFCKREDDGELDILEIFEIDKVI